VLGKALLLLLHAEVFCQQLVSRLWLVLGLWLVLPVLQLAAQQASLLCW
jgi:hypothetical protein